MIPTLKSCTKAKKLTGTSPGGFDDDVKRVAAGERANTRGTVITEGGDADLFLIYNKI